MGGVYQCSTGDMHISCDSCIAYMMHGQSSETFGQSIPLLSSSKYCTDIKLIMSCFLLLVQVKYSYLHQHHHTTIYIAMMSNSFLCFQPEDSSMGAAVWQLQFGVGSIRMEA